MKLTHAVKHAHVVDAPVLGPGGERFDPAEVAVAAVGGLVRDPRTGPLITTLFERRRDGEPVADLSRWLRDQTGRSWAPTVVSKLLRNRVYVGEESLHRATRDPRTGAVVSRELLVSRPDDHAPLTSEATFRAAQHARGVRRVGDGRGREAWLLTGLVRCAGCRYLVRASSNGRRFRTYICVGEHGMGRCPAPAYAAAGQLEEFVLRAVLALDDVDVTVRGARAELDQARAAADDLREQVRRLVGQLRRSRHPDLIEVELDQAEVELETADRGVAELEQRERAHGSDQTRSLATILTLGTADEKRAVLAAYLDRVIVRRGAEPLPDRTLLLLRDEERAFEPLPARGRKVALAPWPPFPARVAGDALKLAG